MQTRSALWRVCSAAVLALSAQGASAQFVARDSDAFGADGLVTDTVSGLTWLNLNVTRGLSYDAVTSELASDTNFSDFRIATSNDVATLFTNAGFFVDSYPLNSDFTDPARLAANASFADAFDPVPQAIGPGSGTSGLFVGNTFLGNNNYSPDDFITFNPNDPTPWYNASVALVGYTPGRVGVASTDTTGPSRNLAVPYMSTWVVSTSAVSPVPEPGTYVLTLAGLAAVASAVRRRFRLAGPTS